jgi:predicted enzyme related to lactoylglutathione lyase
MNTHNQINYIEMPARDLPATKKFFGDVFGWTFTDYGPDYCSFSNDGVDGGFFESDLIASTSTGSVLVVLYSSELEKTQAKVEASGGMIIRPIYSFPGGRRFHFTDPNGNEFSVWSE